jgi:predicted ATPase
MQLPATTPETFIDEHAPKGWRKVVAKGLTGRDYFRDERTSWNNAFRFGAERSALGSLPEDPERFPVSIGVRDILRTGVRLLELGADELRSPSAPGSAQKLAMDGSNLPHVVAELSARDPDLFQQWVAHLKTGLRGLEDVDVWERPEDKHLVLRARFAGHHDAPVPSWLLSDGTLRLMALTLVSYAADEATRSMIMVEEPENGLHPLAIEAAFAALSTPPGSVQVLCATHSPIFLAQTELEHVLVFRRSSAGFAVVRRGAEVPELRDWKGGDLAGLFVTGVLS